VAGQGLTTTAASRTARLALPVSVSFQASGTSYAAEQARAEGKPTPAFSQKTEFISLGLHMDAAAGGIFKLSAEQKIDAALA